MPRCSFQYTKIPISCCDPFPNGTWALRPIVKARISAPSGQHVNTFVLLDTGADDCMFPLSFSRSLGFDPLAMKMSLTGGVGNVSNYTYYASVEIDLFIGAPFVVYAGFTEGLDASGFGLLGQRGFFESFPVYFNRKKNQFHIDVPD